MRGIFAFLRENYCDNQPNSSHFIYWFCLTLRYLFAWRGNPYVGNEFWHLTRCKNSLGGCNHDERLQLSVKKDVGGQENEN